MRKKSHFFVGQKPTTFRISIRQVSLFLGGAETSNKRKIRYLLKKKRFGQKPRPTQEPLFQRQDAHKNEYKYLKIEEHVPPVDEAPNQPNKIDQSRPHEEFESCQAVSTREKELQRDITLDPHGIPPSTSNTSPKDRSPTIEEKEKEVEV